VRQVSVPRPGTLILFSLFLLSSLILFSLFLLSSAQTERANYRSAAFIEVRALPLALLSFAPRRPLLSPLLSPLLL
tara:strand:- start:231 stop:458 length:228 start_codon:yes stop_codon:yes gene_type:complete